MHTVSPYTIRSFNPLATNVLIKDRYFQLDKVGQFDAYQVLKAHIESLAQNYQLDQVNKQIYRFFDMQYDDVKREFTGWMQAGRYGTKNDIINVKTGAVDFQKAQHNAEILNHYIRFWLPAGLNEGVVLLHNIQNVGIKTLLFEILNTEFKGVTSRPLQMNPLAYEKAYDNWKNASAKEIKLVKFTGMNDPNDQLKSLGHFEQELTIKPPRKGTFGELKDFFKTGTAQHATLEFLTPLCYEVKTVVEMDGKKRTFRIGTSPNNQVCQVEVDEKIVPVVDGNPHQVALHDWCTTLLKEFKAAMYPGMKI